MVNSNTQHDLLSDFMLRADPRDFILNVSRLNYDGFWLESFSRLRNKEIIHHLLKMQHFHTTSSFFGLKSEILDVEKPENIKIIFENKNSFIVVIISIYLESEEHFTVKQPSLYSLHSAQTRKEKFIPLNCFSEVTVCLSLLFSTRFSASSGRRCRLWIWVSKAKVTTGKTPFKNAERGCVHLL